MKTGYPRFFIPRIVNNLARRLLEIHESRTASAHDQHCENAGEKHAFLFSTLRYAQLCHQFLCAPRPPQQGQHECRGGVDVYTVCWDGRIVDERQAGLADGAAPRKSIGQEDVFLVSYPSEMAIEAKAFWQHTGFGISSRRATYWLQKAQFLSESAIPSPPSSPIEISLQDDQAKTELKRRIAAGQSVSSEGLIVSEDDVFLFQTGMTAIAETAAAIKLLCQSPPESPQGVAVFGSVPFPPPTCSLANHCPHPASPT